MTRIKSPSSDGGDNDKDCSDYFYYDAAAAQAAQAPQAALGRPPAFGVNGISLSLGDLLIRSKRSWIQNFRSRVFVVQGYSYDQRLEYVDIDFNVPHTPIVGLGQ